MIWRHSQMTEVRQIDRLYYTMFAGNTCMHFPKALNQFGTHTGEWIRIGFLVIIYRPHASLAQVFFITCTRMHIPVVTKWLWMFYSHIACGFIVALCISCNKNMRTRMYVLHLYVLCVVIFRGMSKPTELPVTGAGYIQTLWSCEVSKFNYVAEPFYFFADLFTGFSPSSRPVLSNSS